MTDRLITPKIIHDSEVIFLDTVLKSWFQSDTARQRRLRSLLTARMGEP